jgi:hypothetical protein
MTYDQTLSQRSPMGQQTLPSCLTACGDRPPQCPHVKNPENGNLFIFRIVTPNLVSKVLY